MRTVISFAWPKRRRKLVGVLNVSHRGSIPEEKVAYDLIVNTIDSIVSVSRVIMKNDRTNSRCYKRV
jgi:hypothetical protein